MVGSIEREIGGPASVGVAMPGAISPATGLVKNANSTCLNGRPFDAISQRRWAGRYAWRTTPIALPCPRQPTVQRRRVAPCSASSSGPGWAVGSRLMVRSSEAPMRLPANGATTRCHGRPGKNGLAPTVIAAGRAASRLFYRARRWRPIIVATSEEDLSPAEIASAAARGDERCRATYDALYRPAGARARDGDQSD